MASNVTLKREDCLFFARECSRQASEIKKHEHREAFLAMARLWNQLALEQTVVLPAEQAFDTPGNVRIPTEAR